MFHVFVSRSLRHGSHDYEEKNFTKAAKLFVVEFAID